ncbi:MAG: carbohydrate-binding domain-containing protein [Anaerolineae bacterium]|nr:carbohydrate-binding domain-containing protein [Anaerolineae bacterium]
MKRKSLVSVLVALFLVTGGIGSASAQSDTETLITLSADGIGVDGEGATAANGVVTISAAGSYRLSGALPDGQIVVDTTDAGLVSLILDGVEISSAGSAPISVQNAESAVVVLPQGTQNVITTTAPYAEGAAAILSASSLAIDGGGSLVVTATANDGIASAGALAFSGAPIITVNAGDDAVQVGTVLTVTGGEFNLTAGGGSGSGSSLSEELSGKGVKAEEQIVLAGASITIDAADDGVRSEKDLVMNSGALTISAVGKAVHASYNMEINDGEITVLTSDEGLEAGFITINDGTIRITATDDGINISEPDDIPNPSLYLLRINGGYTVVDAAGDGIDSNGSVEMNDGVVIVNGPTETGNGALDYDGTFTISGGLLVAVGSAGMPAAPGQTSSQPSLLVNFDAALDAGTLVHIQSSDGDDVLTFAPTKTFQSLAFSSPELVQGESYVIYSDGEVNGTARDGLYTDGTYTPGVEQSSFTVSSITTQIGNVRGPRGGRTRG